MKKKIISETRGIALITVLLLTVLLILMTVSMVFISTNHLSMTGNIEIKEKALKSAEAGIEYAIYMLDQNPAWGLTGDPNFPDVSCVVPGDANTWITSSNNDSLNIDEPYTSDCAFNITFNPSSATRSENNLFSHKTGDGGTPPYTAKIVSTGKVVSGSRVKATKTLVTYLVRSDYSPYSINVADKIGFGGSDGNISICGREPNDAGSIYSGAGGKSIDVIEGMHLTSNKGILSARGTIDVPTGFDGKTREELSQDYSFGKIEIGDILDNAKNNKYGHVTQVSSGEVNLTTAIDWGEGNYYSYVKFDSSSSNFASCVTVENSPGTAILKLTDDMYVDGLPSETLKIIGSPVVLEQEHRVGYMTEDGPRYHFVNNGTRITYLDLNGHNIYSNCSLTFGIDLKGNGKIISNGDVHYRMGVNTGEVITASAGNIELELSQYTVPESYGKGLLYAAGNIKIHPLNTTSEIFITGENTVDSVQEYLVETKFTQPNSQETVIGVYHAADNNAKPPKPAYYDGNGMKITKVVDNSGNYNFIASGADGNSLNICIDNDDHKNIDFGNYRVRVIPGTSGVMDVKLVNEDGEPVGNPQSIGLTPTQLQAFGAQIDYYYKNFSSSVDVNFKGTIAGLNTLEFNPGAHGNINVNFYPDYINSMVNIQRKFFTVRKISTYEL